MRGPGPRRAGAGAERGRAADDTNCIPAGGGTGTARGNGGRLFRHSD